MSEARRMPTSVAASICIFKIAIDANIRLGRDPENMKLSSSPTYLALRRVALFTAATRLPRFFVAPPDRLLLLAAVFFGCFDRTRGRALASSNSSYIWDVGDCFALRRFAPRR